MKISKRFWLKNPFRRAYTKSEKKIFDFLSKNKLFVTLTKREMLLFLPYLHLRTYRQNEAVFFRNDPSQAIYIIREGEVQLTLDVNDRFENICGISKYASVGNNALIRKSRRLYNVIAVAPVTEIYVLPQVNILHVFEKYPIIKAKMLESLSQIFDYNNQVLFHTYQSTEGFFDLKEMFKGLQYGA